MAFPAGTRPSLDKTPLNILVYTKLGSCTKGALPGGKDVVLVDESASSANVALVLGHDGKPEVHKTSSHEGIDGNGRGHG